MKNADPNTTAVRSPLNKGSVQPSKSSVDVDKTLAFIDTLIPAEYSSLYLGFLDSDGYTGIKGKLERSAAVRLIFYHCKNRGINIHSVQQRKHTHAQVKRESRGNVPTLIIALL